MKKVISLLLCVCMLALVIPVAGISAAAPSASLLFTAPEEVVSGRRFYVSVQIKAVDTQQLAGICFDIQSNNAAVTPALVPDTTLESSPECIYVTPGDSAWEEAISLIGTSGYKCMFMADDTGSDASCVQGERVLEVRLPFIGNTDSDLDVGFTVSDEYGVDINLEAVVVEAGPCGNVKLLSEKDCLTALGAQINTSISALRFGAEYTAVYLPDGAVVTDIGILLAPTKFITGEFTLLTEGAAAVHAGKIINFESGKAFDEYKTVQYAVVLRDIPAKGYDTAISARPYVTYTIGAETFTAYGETIERTYNQVLDANTNHCAKDSGDNEFTPTEDFWG